MPIKINAEKKVSNLCAIARLYDLLIASLNLKLLTNISNSTYWNNGSANVNKKKPISKVIVKGNMLYESNLSMVNLPVSVMLVLITSAPKIKNMINGKNTIKVNKNLNVIIFKIPLELPTSECMIPFVCFCVIFVMKYISAAKGMIERALIIVDIMCLPNALK